MDPIICTWNALLPRGPDVVWPDGCRDLIAIITKNHKPKVICSALDSSPRHIFCPDETQFVGVRLSPGTTFHWDQSSTSKTLLDFDLSDYFNAFYRDENIDIQTHAVLNQLVNYVNSFAVKTPAWLAHFFEDLIGETTTKAYMMSERTIRRKVVQTTGAPPRYWYGIARARRASLEVCRSEKPLSYIAADYGFSDQAHMTREFQRWFNSTPMRLRANKECSLARLTGPDMFHQFW